jgi:hypothetical protein
MGVCGVCNLSIHRTDKVKIVCKQCKLIFHGNCVNLRETDLQMCEDVWMCSKCTTKFRLQRSGSDSTPVKSTTSTSGVSPSVNEEVLTKALCNVKDDILRAQSLFREDISSSLNEFREKLDGLSALFGKQEAILLSQQEIIRSLQTENERLRGRVDMFEARMDDLEQRSRANVVELYGIPEVPGEDVTDVAVKVCGAVGMEIGRDAIDACHRSRKTNNRPTSGIVVKFVRRRDADEVLQKRRMKRDLNTSHINLPGEGKPIYINQSLTADRRKLFAKARQLKNVKGLKYVWTDRSGRIKIRRDDGGKVIVIKSQGDLDTI